MKFVIQRVSEASVSVDNRLIGEIQKGYMVLIGISENDSQEIADKMVRKMIGLRIFEDEQGKTNLSLADVNGSLLLISQFHSTPTVKREIDQALLKQVLRTKPILSMNILLKNVKNLFLMYNKVLSVQI